MATRQFMLFAVIGAVGFAVDGGLMTAISKFSGLSAMEARPFSFAVAVTVTWWLNRRFTFTRSADGRVSEWMRYAAVNGFGALVNLAVFYLIMLAFPLLRAYPLTVLAIAATVALVANFAGSRRLVFGKAAPACLHADGASCRVGRHG